MPLRRLLFAAAVVVVAATAASWLAQRGPLVQGPETARVARSARGASAAGQPPQVVRPRRGAGAVGARPDSPGAVAAPGEHTNGASQDGDAGGPHDGARAWSGRGVEAIPPPTPGRDPRDGEPARESGAPPDPTSIASGGSPASPTPRAAPAPRSDSAPHASPSDSAGPANRDAQIDPIVREQLAGLPPDRAAALEPPVRKQVAADFDKAYGLTTTEAD